MPLVLLTSALYSMEQEKSTEKAEKLMREGLNLMQAKQLEAGRARLHESAVLGNVEAQYHLGRFYIEASMYASKPEQREELLTHAQVWLSKAASQGHAQAPYNLGFCYYQLGVFYAEKSKALAATLLQNRRPGVRDPLLDFDYVIEAPTPAAEAAQIEQRQQFFDLLDQATLCFKSAVELGQVSAFFNLGCISWTLFEWTTDASHRKEHLERAEVSFLQLPHFAEVQFHLAVLYVAKSHLYPEQKQAFMALGEQHLVSAAQQNHPLALCHLAISYWRESIFIKDRTQKKLMEQDAIGYFKRAARLGSEKAKHHLCEIYKISESELPSILS